MFQKYQLKTKLLYCPLPGTLPRVQIAYRLPAGVFLFAEKKIHCEASEASEAMAKLSK